MTGQLWVTAGTNSRGKHIKEL